MVDKLKKIEEIMSIVFLSLTFKDGRETYNRGRVGLLMGERGWYLPLCKL